MLRGISDTLANHINAIVLPSVRHKYIRVSDVRRAVARAAFESDGVSSVAFRNHVSIKKEPPLLWLRERER